MADLKMIGFKLFHISFYCIKFRMKGFLKAFSFHKIRLYFQIAMKHCRSLFLLVSCSFHGFTSFSPVAAHSLGHSAVENVRKMHNVSGKCISTFDSGLWNDQIE